MVGIRNGIESRDMQLWALNCVASLTFWIKQFLIPVYFKYRVHYS